VEPSTDDTSAPADDTSAPPDDPEPPPDECRNLVISPPSVLLDATGGGDVTTQVTLTNSCLDDADPLEVSGLILADDSGAFSLSASPPYTIPSSMSITIDVGFTPLDEQTRTSFVIVVSNDPDNPNGSIGMVGRPPPDADGDGFITVTGGGDDCDDSDATVHPEAEEIWYDGVDSNCDGASDYDADGDGFESLDFEGTDCDDADAAVHPEAEEIWYDGLDANCDELSDFDADGDGFESLDFGGVDCIDVDPDAYPDALDEPYDGIDSDCDGLSDFDADGDGHDHIDYGGDDCDDSEPTTSPSDVELLDGVDNDCDGTIDEETGAADDDGDGFNEADGDCDDSDASIHPAADELCDSIDNNCNGEIDEADGADCIDWYEDADRDGYGSGEALCLCASEGTRDSTEGTDCNDLMVTIHPGAAETWYDGSDSDCDGLSDNDSDLDGHDATFAGGGDCNDLDPAIHPDAIEIPYDGVDSNCDSASDNDADVDGYDHIDYGGSDCDDDDPTIAPGAAEIQDLIDQDCDGFIDEDNIEPGDIMVSEVMITPLFTSEWDGEFFEVHNTSDFDIDMINWMIADADNSFTVESSLVVPAGGFAVFGVNADLTYNGGVNVDYLYEFDTIGFTHSADNLRIELDGTVIGLLSYSPTWDVELGRSLSLDMDFMNLESVDYASVWCPSISYMDGGDRGTPGEANDACLETDWDLDGYTELDGDCDDWDDTVNPAAVEVCDAVDNDCDEIVDEDGAEGSTYWHRDFDGDGYGNLVTAVFKCEGPDGFVEDDSDCDDMDADRNPGVDEVWYDGVDADCDYLSDFDSDFDTFDHIDYGGLDCDDEAADVNPTAMDVWYDGIDSDCGGEDDYDVDGDGYQSDAFGGLDCADDNPDVSPAAPEYWNGVDDNCVGGRDDFMIMGFSTLVVTATDEINLGHQSGLSSGDFNGDGTTDLIVAADRGGYYEEGAAYMLDGSSPWTLTGDPLSVSSARFSGSAAGNFMGTLGEHQVNLIGTSKADLLVAGTDSLDGHAMCLIDGETLSGPVSCLDARIRWTGATDDFPRVINHLDMDGDGFPEVIYSDSWDGAGDTGKIYAFNGASLVDGDYALLTDNDWRIDGRHAYDYVGSQLGGGDLDGDGYDELLIGAYGDDHPDPKTGSIFIMAGGSSEPVPLRTAQFDKDGHIYGETTNAQVGRWNPSAIADINGDGVNDLAVASTGTESVHVFYTAGDLIGGASETTDADLTINGIDESSHFGIGLTAGDFDGDSFDDLAIGAPDEATPGDGTSDSEGHVYVFFGGEIAGSSLTASFAGAHFFGRADGDNFGALIRSGFDMNDDDRDDLLIAAPGNTLTTSNAGQVHILMMPGGR
jgi:hypothetical protein